MVVAIAVLCAHRMIETSSLLAPLDDLHEAMREAKTLEEE